MIRKRTEWKFRDRSVVIGERTLIAGILNVTPDSFSDGGNYSDPESALHRALQLQRDGADLIDVGAESTRPGSQRISEAEETRRLIPVLKKLKGRLDIPISVDTYKAAVAELALEHGADIINDVSGLTWEPDLGKVVLREGAGLILNHMRGRPDQWTRMPPMRDVMGEITAELEAAVHRARRLGIEVDHIVIDPGIGFGKRKEQNSEILARLGELRKLLLPILVGPSRKSFLARQDPAATEFATAAAVTAAILNGASIVRVHDAAAMRPVVETADAVIAAIPERKEEPRERRPAREMRREREREEEERKRPIRPPAARTQPEQPPEPERRPWREDREPQRRESRPPRPDRDRGPAEGEQRKPYREERKPWRGDREPQRRESRPPRPDRDQEQERPPFPRGPRKAGPPRRGGPPPKGGGPRRGGPPRNGRRGPSTPWRRD